jgi:hypothetical protein
MTLGSLEGDSVVCPRGFKSGPLAGVGRQTCPCTSLAAFNLALWTSSVLIADVAIGVFGRGGLASLSLQCLSSSCLAVGESSCESARYFPAHAIHCVIQTSHEIL